MKQMDIKKPMHIHFIGVGGSSMNGLAIMMKSRGHTVTGSDCAHTAFTDDLENQGIPVMIGQKAENIQSPDLVVYSAAIKEDNEELAAARSKGITTMERAAFLGKITEGYSQVVGIAGCHGKTTITSMVALIAMAQQESPTVHVGGNVPFLHGGTHVGTRDLFITEACEYVNSYHQFHVTLAVINNIDDDHLDFFKNMENVYASFLQYANQVPKSGLLLYNSDDPLVKKIGGQVGCRVQSYALHDEGADWQARNMVQHEDATTYFDLYYQGKLICPCHLTVPGLHNVQNALAAIAICHQLGVPAKESAELLTRYRLTNRRFEDYGSKNEAKIYHDYAHHPTEMAACIQTAQALPHNKLLGVFQCHTYSRAILLKDKYAKTLSCLDEVLLPDIYAAREKDPGTIHARDLAEAINQAGGNAKYFASFEAINDYLTSHLAKGDILLAMGAGDIGQKARIFADEKVVDKSE